MTVKHYDTIDNGSYYEVEMYKAEDVAENGDNADIIKVGLPLYFDMNNEEMVNKYLVKIEEILIDKGMDTFHIAENRSVEYLYHIEEGS